MYPAQTSLIPVTVALVRYIKNLGISGNYPFWYLGTTPTKYLIGPIVPFLEIFINKISSLSFFDISIYLVIFSHLLSIVGWSILIHRLSKNKKLTFIFLIFLILFPWRLFSSLTIQETSFVLARNIIPFVLISTYSYFRKKNILGFLKVIFLHCFVLLVHTGIIPILLVLETSLVLSISYKKKKFVNLSKYIKNIVLLFFIPIVAVTFWYGPKYWLTIFFNPSLGGLSVIKVVSRIFELFRWFIPIALAILVTRLFEKGKKRLKIFTFLFLAFFGVLTFYRFISDWDFWMDWSAWLFEIEVGLAILISSLLVSIKKLDFSKVLYLLIFLSFPFWATFLVYTKMEKPKIISENPPDYTKTINYLQSISKDSLVFLSGSSVFWANSFFDVYQLRGGRDEVSVNPDWNKASYELRESNNLNTLSTWLSRYKVEYVLVHTKDSKEYYQDFSNQNIWTKVATLIFSENGDFIYKINTRILSE